MHYSPVCRFTPPPKESFSHDLHVLSTPPAFALSQDQTLHHISCGSYNPNKTQNSFDFRAYYSIFDELTPLLQGKIKYKHFLSYVKKNFYFFATRIFYLGSRSTLQDSIELSRRNLEFFLTLTRKRQESSKGEIA